MLPQGRGQFQRLEMSHCYSHYLLDSPLLDSYVTPVKGAIVDGGRIYFNEFNAAATIAIYRGAWIKDDIVDGYIG